MSDTTPSGTGEQVTDAGINGGEATDAPSTQVTEVENGEQMEEASADDLLAEATDLIAEETPTDTARKPVDEKALTDFQKRDESLKLDAKLLRGEGKSNIEVIKELQESGLYPDDQINRLKKLMASGQLEDSTESGDPETEHDRFRRWQAEENQKSEKEQSLRWFTETYAKDLGIGAKFNSVAIESRKKLLIEAQTHYNQTLPEHRNFKKSIELMASHLGLNDKVKTQEAVKKAVKAARTSPNTDTGEPQKITKTSYTHTELDALLKSNKAAGMDVLRKVQDGKIKLVNDIS